MGLPNIGPIELIIILAVLLLVVGPRRLPEMGQAVGKTIREFRKASTDITESATVTSDAKTVSPAAAATVTAAASAAPAPAPAPALPPHRQPPPLRPHRCRRATRQPHPARTRPTTRPARLDRAMSADDGWPR